MDNGELNLKWRIENWLKDGTPIMQIWRIHADFIFE